MLPCHGVQYRLQCHEAAVTLKEGHALLGGGDALSITAELRGQVQAVLQFMLLEVGIARVAPFLLHLRRRVVAAQKNVTRVVPQHTGAVHILTGLKEDDASTTWGGVGWGGGGGDQVYV